MSFLLFNFDLILQPVNLPAVVRGDGSFVTDYADGAVQPCFVEKFSELCKLSLIRLKHLLSDVKKIIVIGSPDVVQFLTVTASCCADKAVHSGYG